MSLFVITCEAIEKFDGSIPKVRDLISTRGRRVRVNPDGTICNHWCREYPKLENRTDCSQTEPAAVIDSRVADLVPGFREFLKDMGRLMFYKDIVALQEQ